MLCLDWMRLRSQMNRRILQDHASPVELTYLVLPDTLASLPVPYQLIFERQGREEAYDDALSIALSIAKQAIGTDDLSNPTLRKAASGACRDVIIAGTANQFAALAWLLYHLTRVSFLWCASQERCAEGCRL